MQGLFAGVASGIGGQATLTLLKSKNIVRCMTLICAVAMAIAFVLSFLLPESIRLMGKQSDGADGK